MFNPDNDGPPDDSPESLKRIAERMRNALEAGFDVKSDAERMAASRAVSDEAQQPFRPVNEEGHAPRESIVDRRLYVPFAEGWEVRIKSGPREYCCVRNPGEDWFHLLVNGEVYLQFGSEVMCLNCAYRLGHITDDRLFWQTGRHRAVLPPLAPATSSGVESPRSEPPLDDDTTLRFASK